MSADETEEVRRTMLALGQPYDDLEKVKAEQAKGALDALTWDTDALRKEFVVHSFLAPFCFVTRISDGAKGTLEFTHSPRYYFNFVKDEQ